MQQGQATRTKTVSWSGALTALALACLVLALACTPAEDAGEDTTDASPEALLEQARSVHATALVLDAHADAEIPGQESRYVGADGRSEVAPDKMQAGGMDAVVLAVAVGPGPRDANGFAEARATANAELAAIHQIASDPANDAVVARTADELEAAHADGKTAFLVGFQNARILGTDPAGLDQFYEQGARVFAMTHMGHNDFADSSRPVFIGETGEYEVEEEHGGLSDLGRAFVERVNALGGVVDVSQLSKNATLQAIELSATPVIASHSNVKALTNVRRNLTDEEIDAIGAAGGVVHVAAFIGYLFDSNSEELDTRIREARAVAGIPLDYDYPFELYWEIDDPEVQSTYINSVRDILGPGSVKDLVNHLDYVVGRIGVDHVGIGNDFNHGGGLGDFVDASQALNVTAELLARGYSEEDIQKIWSGNFLRVLRAAEAGKED